MEPHHASPARVGATETTRRFCLARCAAGLVEPGNRNARDPRRFGDEPGIARIEGGHPFQVVLVDQLDELAEPRADEHHVGEPSQRGQADNC